MADKHRNYITEDRILADEHQNYRAEGRILADKHQNTHTHAYTHTHAHTHTHTHTHTLTHTKLHYTARTHARTHGRKHARTHARTHTHTLKRKTLTSGRRETARWVRHRLLRENLDDDEHTNSQNAGSGQHDADVESSLGPHPPVHVHHQRGADPAS